MKKAILPLIFLGLMGCQTTKGPISAIEPMTTESNLKSVNASNYQPGGRKEYVFKEKKPSFQKYPITNFCRIPEKDSCFSGINYSDYVGKKFYYTSDEPIKYGGIGGFYIYELRVNTGETLYHYRKKELGAIDDTHVIALNDIKAAQSFKEEPIVEGSSIFLTNIKDSSIKFGHIFGLSNGGTITENQLSALRKLSDKFGEKKTQIANLLINFQVNYDKMEDRFFIQPFPYETSGTYIIGYIGYEDEKGPWLRAKALYRSDDWLFINRALIVADDFRLDTNQVKFERDHSSGAIWEWMDVPATKGKFYDALVAISKASSATIRFNGNQYYKDFDIPKNQKKLIADVLSLFKIMND